MPKTKQRKKGANRRPTASTNGKVAVQERPAPEPPVSRQNVQARNFTGSGGLQGLVFSGMIAIGFWGFAIFCIFFFGSDPNHYLYGGVMALTAIGWSVILVRRWLTYRSRA